VVQVASDQLLQPKNFTEFLQQKIKVSKAAAHHVTRHTSHVTQVQNKTGNLGESIKVETDDKKVTVKSSIPLSKRYLKYLAKKYLKRNNLRNFLHVVSTDKNKYELKYFNIDSKVSGA